MHAEPQRLSRDGQAQCFFLQVCIEEKEKQKEKQKG